MTAAPITTVRAIVSGRVQGVWFRGWTREQASKLGLNGWVRNRRDGTVEALFSGGAEAVGEMLALCRQGPPSARVEGLETRPAEAPEGAGFRQLPTL